ncbi:5-methylcytosine-specific restriction enzyme subunit McrC [Nocardia ignorata]|uniref:5-methylcytosine-specific restriction enzyme subunit McrC n=1 Tax=Nocardia ignorata TaxID=145285 RepID=A0A4R6P4G7_NOCIG|nr:5-methylcytosine-specific restriction enzyme subunit McrC [Nocardia ignorata]
MIERAEVRISEYASVSVADDQLTAADLVRLRALQDRRRFSVEQSRTGWRLTARATVGVLNLDRIRLVIDPKLTFTGESLIRWLCYALAAPVPHDATAREWSVSRTGFADIVAAALLHECRILARDGLRRDYVRTQQLAPVLRGRFDAVSQATRRYGMLDQLHLDTFDRSPTIWENEVCGHALRAARAMVSDPVLAQRLSVLAAEFPASGRVSGAVRALNRATYTRLNRRYRPAHVWAGLVLRAGGVTDLLTDVGSTAESLLLDLPTLWETAVARILADAAPPGATTATATKITVTGDISTRTFRPDVVVTFRPTTAPHYFPVDAKYKRYEGNSVSADDTHQLLTYISGYSPTDTPEAAIIHPATHRHSHRTLRIRGNNRHLGTIHTIGIDVDRSPASSAAWLRSELWGPESSQHTAS